MTIHLELLKGKLSRVLQPVAAGGARRPTSALRPPTSAATSTSSARDPASRSGPERLPARAPDELKLSRRSSPPSCPTSSRRSRPRPSGAGDREARRSGPAGDQRRPGDAAPGAAQSRAERVPGDARRRHAPDHVPRAAPQPRRWTSKTGIGIRREPRRFADLISRPRRGTGIGLSMVYRIVQLHDGEVECSHPGQRDAVPPPLSTGVD